MKSHDICGPPAQRRFVTLRLPRRAIEALRCGYDQDGHLFTRIGESAHSIPVELARLMASDGPKHLMRYRGIGPVAVRRIAEAFDAHGIAFSDPVRRGGPLWLEIADPKNSSCPSCQIRDLDFSYWWQDDGYLHVRQIAPHDPDDQTFHRVHCRLTDRPRIALCDGKLWWLVDRRDDRAALVVIRRFSAPLPKN